MITIFGDIVERNISKRVFLSICIVAIAISLLDFLFTLIAEISDLSLTYTLLDALTYSLYSIPGSIYAYLSYICLLGVLIGLGSLKEEGEIIAAKVLGKSNFKMVLASLRPATLIIIIGLIFQELYLPSISQSNEEIRLIKQNRISAEEGYWFASESSINFFGSSPNKNTVTDVEIYELGGKNDITKVISSSKDQGFLSMSMMVSKERTVFIGDVNIHDTPNAEQLANIATGVANTVKDLGYTPRVALLSFSNFGSLSRPSSENLKQAVKILDARKVDFEFDGEMTPEVALDYDLIKENYPFCRLSGPANVLIMPSLLAANISFKLLQKIGNGTVLGPLMIGGEKPFQIVQMGSSVSDIVNSASISAYNALYTK